MQLTREGARSVPWSEGFKPILQHRRLAMTTNERFDDGLDDGASWLGTAVAFATVMIVVAAVLWL
jgi:hypothetical protein